MHGLYDIRSLVLSIILVVPTFFQLDLLGVVAQTVVGVEGVGHEVPLVELLKLQVHLQTPVTVVLQHNKWFLEPGPDIIANR